MAPVFLVHFLFISWVVWIVIQWIVLKDMFVLFGCETTALIPYHCSSSSILSFANILRHTMKRLRIHILQTELQGRISDLNLLGKYIHRQTIWLGLRGCSALQCCYLIYNPLPMVPSSSYIKLGSAQSETASSATESKRYLLFKNW